MIGCTVWKREARAVSGPTSACLPTPADPRRPAPRELRGIPGVGDRRAVDLARARWLHDPARGPFRPSDVPGIGPRTERAVAAWLAVSARDLTAPAVPPLPDRAQDRKLPDRPP